ncbi:class I SAM-dependent methyltransferase [candidate division KSB1 bacterium]|nr:class I SAM-dependent methyltransferase [candidate division KSB1 bacterium]
MQKENQSKPSIRCILCNSVACRTLHIKNMHEILRCDQCGFIFAKVSIDETDKESFVKKLYDKNYFEGNAHWFDKNLGYGKNYFEEKGFDQTVNANRHLKKIEKLILSKGRLLDVGCAAGFFLNVARQRGWEVAGLELSADAAAYAKAHFDLDISIGSFETASLPAASFDVITAWDVIEHLLDPLAFVENAARLLKNNGLMVLGTPNIGSLAYKFRKIRWIQLKPPEHVCYYNPETLKRLLKNAFIEVKTQAVYPQYSKVKFSFRAYGKRLLYSGFNMLAQILNQGEYVIGYAWKRGNSQEDSRALHRACGSLSGGTK